MGEVIVMKSANAANKFLADLSKKDVEYMVISFQLRGDGPLLAAFSPTTNAKSLHAASFLLDRIKKVVFP